MVTSCLTNFMNRALTENLIVTELFKKNPCYLCNPKVHHRVHKSPPLNPNLRHMNPVHNFIFFKTILILSTYLCLIVRGKKLSIRKWTKMARRSYQVCIKLTSSTVNRAPASQFPNKVRKWPKGTFPLEQHSRSVWCRSPVFMSLLPSLLNIQFRVSSTEQVEIVIKTE
jgi:hypothetical protein